MICLSPGFYSPAISKDFAFFLSRLGLAYLEARRHKRWKNNTLQFSSHSEENLLQLALTIKNRTYAIKPSLCFIALSPVKREIFAGDFRDRIIHHLIFDELNFYYDNLFINDCYSCRKEKGTDYGIGRIAGFIKEASKNFQRPAYVLKLDISGYFMNIDRDILYRKNKEMIKRLYYEEAEKINTLLYLLRLVIFNNPTKNCRQRGPYSDWDGLPKNKSLFDAPFGRGLPIGNLTSQLFGNVYLNDFDHFIKEKLKCRYYGRYVDDMIFISDNKEYLISLIPKIADYLRKNLGLTLHPKKIYLQPYQNGVNFLGTFIKPRRIYIGSRIKGNFYKKIKQLDKYPALKPIKEKTAFLNSYLGLMKKYQTFNLRRKIMTNPKTKNVLKKLNLKAANNYELVTPDPIDLFKKL